MGLRMEVLKWEDNTGNRMVQRMPEQGMADLKLGARCIVQESQAAIFFRNGKALDTFGPGNHTLSTENIPVISSLFKLAYSGAPFQSCVYYVSLRPHRDLKWGTKEPVTLRDTDFGFVRVRSFGKFSVRITDPKMFVNTVVGSEGRHDAKDIERWFKDLIASRVTDLLASQMQGKSVLDIQGMKEAIGVAIKAKTTEDFAKYGIELYDFILSSISLPEKVQEAIDKRGAMGAIGNMNQYMQYQAANALEAGANNPGGGMGQMMGAGMGMGMGMMMPGMMRQGMGQQPGYPPPGYPPPGYGYPPPGYPPPGYPPPGYPPPGYGYPPQGHPQQGHPPQPGADGQAPQQGQPPQGGHPGYPPPGYPPPGYPPPGYPPQGGHPQHPGQHPGQAPGQHPGQAPPAQG